MENVSFETYPGVGISGCHLEHAAPRLDGLLHAPLVGQILEHWRELVPNHKNGDCDGVLGL